MPTTVLPVTCVRCRECVGSWNGTGERCLVVAVVREVFRGKFSIGIERGFRYSGQDCILPAGSCSHLLCCESTTEEGSAGNRHAAFCGIRERVTAPVDPVAFGNGRSYCES